MPVPPEIPVVGFPTPVVSDRLLIEVWDTLRANQEPIHPGTPHADLVNYTGYVFVQQVAIPGTEAWVRRIWVNDRSVENTYNASISYDAESITHPIFTRDYLVRRLGYAAATKGAALTGVVGVRVTAGGTLYTIAPTVSFSGGAGSGAAATAIIFRGAVVGVVMTAEGTGYTSAPTVAFTNHASDTTGSGATATAYIQPATAALVKEDFVRQPDAPTDSLYALVRRVWHTLPGAQVISRERVRSGVIREVIRQTVVASTVPGSGGGATIRENVNGETTVLAEKVTERYVDDAGTALASNPIFYTQEIRDKDRVVFIHYAQLVASSDTISVLNAAYLTSFIWASSGITAVTVTSGGSAYTSVPTVSAGLPGSGGVAATLAARMKAASATFAASGAGYALNDVLSAVGGTSTTTATFTIGSLGLTGVAENAAGTGYALTNRIALSGGTPLTVSVASITQASPGVFTTTDGAAHNLSTGDYVLVSGVTGTDAAILNGIRQVTRLSASQFSAGVNTTVNSNGATITRCSVLSVTGLLMLSFTLLTAGTGYVVGNVVTFVGGTTISGVATQITVATVGGGGEILTYTVLTQGRYSAVAATYTATGGAGTGATFNAAVYGVFLTDTLTIGGYSATAASFTQAATNGSGSGATFNTPVWGGAALSPTTVGNYSVLPSNPVATTGGSGASATLTILWSVLSVTVTSGGSGYTTTNPPVTFTPTGATGFATLDSASWVSATAYIIDGKLAQQQDSPNQLKTWTTSPVPPDKRRRIRIGIEWPGTINVINNSGFPGSRPSPGINYDGYRGHVRGLCHALETITYQRGEFTPAQLPTIFKLTSPASGSAIFPIGDNFVHNAFSFVLFDGDGVFTYIETFPASSPTYTPGLTVIVGGGESEVWAGDIWSMNTIQANELTGL